MRFHLEKDNKKPSTIATPSSMHAPMQTSVQTIKTHGLRLLLMVIALYFSTSSIAYAHGDGEPLWEMDAKELAEVEERIQQHRGKLLKALDLAFREGFGEETLRRPYNFDSNFQEVEIPRSVLNRVIVSSLEAEIATVEKYLFCNSCEHSLANDLKGHPDKNKVLHAMQSIWPKIKSSFTLLFKEIPQGVWKRIIYASAYSKHVEGGLRYQAKAYGIASMIAGATAFSGAYAVTEVAESIYLVGLHFLCQANYFWSLAFGTAVASLSRDIKTLLFFSKEGKPLWSRIGQTFLNYRSYKALNKLERRVVFQSVIGEGNQKIYQDLTRRAAYSTSLGPVLREVMPLRSVAADPLLWAELISHNPHLEVVSSASPLRQKQKLFQQEIEKIFEFKQHSYEGIYRWHDLASSLRTVIRTFRLDLETQNQIYKNRSDSITVLGKLDANLRSLDLFMHSWLKERRTSGLQVDVAVNAEWLRNMLGEILSVAIETLDVGFDKKVADVRVENLRTILSASVKRGSPIMVKIDGVKRLDSVLRERVVDGATCNSLFGYGT